MSKSKYEKGDQVEYCGLVAEVKEVVLKYPGTEKERFECRIVTRKGNAFIVPETILKRRKMIPGPYSG